jgi:hypothetical protein
MALEKPIHSIRNGSFPRRDPRRFRRGFNSRPLLKLRIDFSSHFIEAPLSKLTASGSQRFPGTFTAIVTVGMKGAVTSIQADFPAARPKEGAAFEVPTIGVKLPVLHGVDITSMAAKSVNYFGIRKFGVNAASRRRRDHHSRVVTLRPTTGVLLAKDARAEFIPEPLPHCFCAKSPKPGPVRYWVVAFLERL